MSLIWPVGKRLNLGKQRDMIIDGKIYNMHRFQAQETVNGSNGKRSLYVTFHLFGHVFRVDVQSSDSWLYKKAVEIIENAKD